MNSERHLIKLADATFTAPNAIQLTPEMIERIVITAYPLIMEHGLKTAARMAWIQLAIEEMSNG